MRATATRKSARRLARLCGSEPGPKRPRRRQLALRRKTSPRKTDAYRQTEQG
jgi:hypothetical protein